MDFEIFARNIKWIRQKKGLSQEEFGSVIGSKRTAIAQWETGKNGASLEVAENIRRIYSLNLDDLYFKDLSISPDRDNNFSSGHLENCKNCEEKEKIITSQRETISALKSNVTALNELLSYYRNNSNMGEKRAG